jgi:hypothetical protein
MLGRLEGIIAAAILLLAATTATQAVTYRFDIAAYPNNLTSFPIVGSFTMIDNEPISISAVAIHATLPSLPSPVEVSFDQVINPVQTWAVGYLWFANHQFSPASTHFWMFFHQSGNDIYQIGMGFNAHHSEITNGVQGWQYIFGEMTRSVAPEPVPLPPASFLYITALAMLGIVGWRTQPKPPSRFWY